MATKTTTEDKIALKLPVVGTVILPALRRLYNMQGASLAFKLAIKKKLEEIDAKRYDALTDVRQAQNELSVAATKEDVEAAQKRLETQYNAAAEKEIEVVGKLPWSLFPDEEKVLSQRWNENNINPETNQPIYLQGDYITEVANIYEHLIDPEK